MILRRSSLAFAVITAVALSTPAHAALNVFACEPEWGALSTELGGSDIDVFVATTARQDPHQIQARPALISRLRNADIAVCTGAELEIGWMPVLLRQSSNGKVQPGSPGYFEATQQVRLLQVPTRLDRAEGDVHPQGNPHVQTDPRYMRVIAAALAKRFAELDPGHAAAYAQRAKAFDDKLGQAIQRWQAQAAPLKGANAVIYHKDWVYLFAWLGINEVATIEPKPGVPPGGAYLAQLLDEVPKRQAKLIVYAAYQDPRAPDFIADKTHIAAVMLPFTVGGSDAAKDLFGLYDDTIKRLLVGLGGNGG
ncbi:MAG TPA: zinc ABC transporter substrate-binding protein [Stellaceae bacterium]|nr:zinc ABC transporter substrate-binding protein [Stellaceae bacterium]